MVFYLDGVYFADLWFGVWSLVRVWGLGLGGWVFMGVPEFTHTRLFKTSLDRYEPGSV